MEPVQRNSQASFAARLSDHGLKLVEKFLCDVLASVFARPTKNNVNAMTSLLHSQLNETLNDLVTDDPHQLDAVLPNLVTGVGKTKAAALEKDERRR